MTPSRLTPLLQQSQQDALAWNATLPSPTRAGATRWFIEAICACDVFEWVSFMYLAWLGAVFLICHRNLANPLRGLVIHAAIVAAILTLARAAAVSRNFAIQFARHWYPLPLYLFFFEELGSLVHAIFPGWFDRFLIRFDFSLGGVHPSIWLARFAGPGLNDFMQFAYMTYFLYLVILPAILYSNRERLAFWTVMVSTAIAHYSVYVIAILLPVESPYHALASLHMKPLEGGPCTAVINLIEHFGRVHGAAFPSAHVAGSMVAILASWRYRRWLFWVCLPFFICMCASTVYGRYHYVADVLAGLVVGAFGFLLGSWLLERNSPRQSSA